jgi:hypothetical protein
MILIAGYEMFPLRESAVITPAPFGFQACNFDRSPTAYRVNTSISRAVAIEGINEAYVLKVRILLLEGFTEQLVCRCIPEFRYRPVHRRNRVLNDFRLCHLLCSAVLRFPSLFRLSILRGGQGQVLMIRLFL